jgi:hypothetical protein
MIDERKPIVSKHVTRIRRSIVGLCALSVAAQVRKHDAIPLLGERVDLAQLEPVRTRAHEAVQQDHRSAGPGLTASKIYAVAANETISAHIVSIVSGPRITPRLTTDDERRPTSTATRLLSRARWRRSKMGWIDILRVYRARLNTKTDRHLPKVEVAGLSVQGATAG